MAHTEHAGDGGIAAPSDRQRRPAEELYADELQALAMTDTYEKPSDGVSLPKRCGLSFVVRIDRSSLLLAPRRSCESFLGMMR